MQKLPDGYICDLTPQVAKYTKACLENSYICEEMYEKYHVFRGLRDKNGKGVLTGLTDISEINAKKEINGEMVPIEGELFYRGIRVEEIIEGCIKDKRGFGFEETAYLLLQGKLPNKQEFEEFKRVLAGYRSLPPSFVRDVIMKAPSKNMMNALARCVLTLYSYDNRADKIGIADVFRQCLQLIAMFPLIGVYSYQAYKHYHQDGSLIIHIPKPEYSTAENILHMLRDDSSFTELEARILDVALILHAEHGGGNNSTFTTRVVSSSGTDTYSAIAASLGSLKGPKHGGANIKVMEMFEDIKAHVPDWTDERALRKYLDEILNGEVFDKAGLIYGLGHAIYTISDPRERVFRGFVKELSEAKGCVDEYNLYLAVERIGIELIQKERKIYKGVCTNIDFFSGFVYKMLDLPIELYTPIFAMARIAGWSAHRMEELINANKIIRPAYMAVGPRKEYIPMDERE
ncbi:MAG: citrate/2-methylcitrate synthase [Firmicutes bacterium]|nr:citrate/2-methylcitrate synthase [Bacillota bacterium]MBR0105013.1 citrate/2-methylcitrate synthase [Bacillota bacterium]